MDQQFKEWLDGVDAILKHKTGLTHDDFADGPSYDSWCAGVSRADYAQQLLDDAGWGSLGD